MRISVALLLMGAVALAADIVPVDQRLALQVAGLTLQVANLGHDLDMCRATVEMQKK